MARPIWFIVQRHHGAEFPALYYDFLPECFTRALPVDDKKQPLGPQLTSYMLRLDRMPEGSEWRERPLAELMALYRRPDLNLPPPNLADPPRDKGQKGVELGKWSMTKPQPWHGLAPEPWPSPGAKQPKPQAGAYIPEDRLDAPG